MRFPCCLGRTLAVFLAVLLSTGCAEFFDVVGEIAFAESPDPRVRAYGEALLEQREEAEAAALADQFLATGDRIHLDRALELRPGDPELHAYNVALAWRDGDKDELNLAEDALLKAQTRRFEAQRGSPEPLNSGEIVEINRKSMADLLVVHSRLLGSSASSPPLDETVARHYCLLRGRAVSQFGRDIQVLLNALPECPEG